MQQDPWYPPPPPGERPPRRPLFRVLVVVGVAAVVFVVGVLAFVLPIPLFFIYQPGPVRDVEDLVVVPGERTYASDGDLFLTTVSVDVDATAFKLVQAAIDPEKTAVYAQDFTGGQSIQELNKEQRIQMRVSKRYAEAVALSALGFGHPTGDGARVQDIQENSPADGSLRRGDIMLAVNGKPIETTCDVMREIDHTAIGGAVTFKVRRDGDVQAVTLHTAPNPLDPRGSFIGVFMMDIDYRFKTPVDVSFKTGEIAGPSAGLMFTLALYDRLTPEDLTKGRSIAGTGEIDCGGGVGPIGGVEQKVAAAEHKGADIFLAPSANAEDARGAADDIKVVSVSTFDDALQYLEGQTRAAGH